MKARIINGQYKTKSNFDFSDDIINSSDYKLKNINQFKISAEITGDSEIVFKAIIPFDGKLCITRSGEKNAIPLISLNVNTGYFITSIPVSMHDETNELNCVLSSENKTIGNIIELQQVEIPV